MIPSKYIHTYIHKIRFWEGRRIWSKMTVCIRTLTRCIWIGVQESSSSKSKDIVEKVSAINLLVAFAYSTKNYLRQDYSYVSENVQNLLGHIQHFSTPSSNHPLEVQEEIANEINQPKLQSQSNYETTDGNFRKRKFLAPHDSVTPTNIPLELSYYLASYIYSVRGRALADSFTISEMNNCKFRITFRIF